MALHDTGLGRPIPHAFAYAASRYPTIAHAVESVRRLPSALLKCDRIATCRVSGDQPASDREVAVVIDPDFGKRVEGLAASYECVVQANPRVSHGCRSIASNSRSRSSRTAPSPPRRRSVTCAARLGDGGKFERRLGSSNDDGAVGKEPCKGPPQQPIVARPHQCVDSPASHRNSDRV